MGQTFDILFITNLPSFYKINLYNEIARRKKIFVIYTGDTAECRNNDFFNVKMQFGSLFLYSNKLLRLLQILYVIKTFSYEKIIIGGWDSLPMWLSAFISPKRKNALVVESSYLESAIDGFKGIMKKVFVSRISIVYASGKSQKKLTDNLGFKGKTVITRGVGIFNYTEQPQYVSRDEVKNFIYVGRLVGVKNLAFLINIFNKLPNLRLNIIGFGKQEQYLKSISNKNIKFYGAIDNKELRKYYQENDVFILPSKSEPWGLVVEEALNSGLPVLVSDKVGCAEEIVNESNGLIFKYDSEEDLLQKIRQITDINYYNKLRKNISKLDFKTIELEQIKSYL